jgi:SNF2 family DNA or RNA helicase
VAEVPPTEALQSLLTGLAEVDGATAPVTAQGWLAAVHRRIADPAGGPEALPDTPGLHADLRGYQRQGLRWLTRMTGLGLGCCLADDMGLGKTVTTIGLHLQRWRPGAGATLVVCPASLISNWEREIRRFAPAVGVRRFHGARRRLDQPTGAAAGEVVLTTYATLRTDVDRLASRRWGLVVADEAQHVKNPRNATARALRALDAEARVALTGTPVENGLLDLWAILDWTTPGLLGSAQQFRTRWAQPVEQADRPSAAGLHRVVAPFLLRRHKRDPEVVPDLPPKTETDHLTALSEEQAKLYEEVCADLLPAIGRHGPGIARSGLVLKLITALKQVCNHPAHYRPDGRAWLRGASGKLDLLDELLDAILAEGQAALVFTQYVAMARLLHQHLSDRGIGALLLHGGLSVPARDELVRSFQTGQAPVFLLSLKAAGTGLNLTRAEHVIHYDRWWNPAVEDQATDRAHRIGQDRAVQVHRLISEGTLEERIADLLAHKSSLAEVALGQSEAALSELSDRQLGELVTLRRNDD